MRKLLTAVLVAAAVAALVWLAGRGARSAPELPVRAPDAPTPPEQRSAETEASSAESREALPEPGVRPESASARHTQDLVAVTLRFLDPGQQELRPERAEVTLTDSAGHSIRRSVERSSALLFEGLAPVRYAAEVHAPGFTHRTEAIDLTGHTAAEGGLREGLTLWPDLWIAIVVQTEDGRPLGALAEALGMEPKRLFVDAFSARAYPQQFTDGEPAPARVLGEFRKPPTYQQWELGESVVGSLVLVESPPLWVGLDFHGQRVGMQHLDAGQTEVVFRLAPAKLESSLARLRVRVFEAQGDSPVAGALVTLRADTSAHRRADQERVPSRDDGAVELERIVPGRYELLVERGDAQYQDRIDLAAGERRDLGIVRLSSGAPLRIVVVDERGEPQLAWLELGPYEAGKDVHDLYPPMLHEMTDLRGQGKLSMPARPSIVRAQQLTPGGLAPSGHNSANVRIDPASPPDGVLRLVILDEARTRITCKLPEARSLVLLDESNLIVFDERLDTYRWKEGRRELEFGRGRYTARLCGAAGEVLHERSVELRAGEQELELP